jgi:hypothetical protein
MDEEEWNGVGEERKEWSWTGYKLEERDEKRQI